MARQARARAQRCGELARQPRARAGRTVAWRVAATTSTSLDVRQLARHECAVRDRGSLHTLMFSRIMNSVTELNMRV